MSSKKLQTEELKQLQDIKQEIIGLASALGEIEYQLTLVELDKESVKRQVKDIKEKEQVLLKDFGQKYGDGIINLDTGEIDSAK